MAPARDQEALGQFSLRCDFWGCPMTRSWTHWSFWVTSHSGYSVFLWPNWELQQKCRLRGDNVCPVCLNRGFSLRLGPMGLGGALSERNPVESCDQSAWWGLRRSCYLLCQLHAVLVGEWFLLHVKQPRQSFGIIPEVNLVENTQTLCCNSWGRYSWLYRPTSGHPYHSSTQVIPQKRIAHLLTYFSSFSPPVYHELTLLCRLLGHSSDGYGTAKSPTGRGGCCNPALHHPNPTLTGQTDTAQSDWLETKSFISTENIKVKYSGISDWMI